MESNSQATNTLLLVIAAILAVGAGYYYYDNYIEPKNDGPLERAGEKIDKAIDGK